MLTIRPRQMDALAKAQTGRELQMLEKQLRSRFDGGLAEYSPEAIQSVIDKGVALAQTHGILGKPELVRLLTVLVEWGSDLETNPEIAWAGNILRRRGRTGAQKLQALEDQSVALGKGRA